MKPYSRNRATFSQQDREWLSNYYKQNSKAVDERIDWENQEQQPVPEQGDLFADELKPKYTLSDEQQEALDTIVAFCMRKTENRMMLLSGTAGTGKTFTLNRAIEKVKAIANWINFGVTAPTHKAVRILKKLSDIKDLLDFGTIHSFLALKQDISSEGKVTYKPDYSSKFERRIDSVNILIVDEASMLDDELFGYLLDEMRSNTNLRIIFTGDPLQINPVMDKATKQKRGHLIAIPFISERQQSHKIKPSHLTKPQRQAAESPIIMYAHTIRENIKSQTIPFIVNPEWKDHLELVPRNGAVLKELFAQFFDTEEFKNDSDYVKVVAWKNATVDYCNNVIRQIIYKREVLPKLMAGEKVVLDQPYIKGEKLILPNNEEVTITFNQAPVIDYTLHYKAPGEVFAGFDGNTKQEVILKVYSVVMVTEDDFKYPAIILHEDSQREFDRIRDLIKKSAVQATDQYERKELWQQYYKIAEKFVWVKYNYCVTAHKSQGSSYDYCISMEWDIDTNKDIEERNRIKYVASTRARKKLFICK